MPDETSESAQEPDYPRLISLAVHELRTPLSVVSGYLRMLREDDSTDARHRHLVEQAERSARRLGTLIEELSDLGKLEAGTAPMVAESVDVFALAHDVARTLPNDTGEEAALEVSGPTTGAPMVADRARLRTALASAVRAVRREYGVGSTVVVDLRRGESDSQPVAHITIAVASDLPRATTAPAAPLNEKRGGVGLGLPIARRVIARFGGRIWSPALNAETGHGSRGPIAIALPLSH